jgi:hypothetical protein
MAVAIHGCWNPSSCLEAPGSERQLSDSRKWSCARFYSVPRGNYCHSNCTFSHLAWERL